MRGLSKTPEISEGNKTPRFRYGRLGNLPSLSKTYNGDKYQYSGVTIYKFELLNALFLEICNHLDVQEEEERRNAFSIILVGAARQYYFDVMKGKILDLLGLVDAVKARFCTSYRTRYFLR